MEEFTYIRNPSATQCVTRCSENQQLWRYWLNSYSQLNLPVHEGIHAGEKPKCNKTFRKSELLKREGRVPTGDKLLSCSQCATEFAGVYVVKTHKQIPADEKPFSCKRCDYKCKQSTALMTHERIHTNKKPFSCSQCDYKCSTSGSLQRMWEPTPLVISHSAANSVITNANNQLHWHMKESTNEK